MKCTFSKSRKKNKGVVRLYGQEILEIKHFWYLESLIHKDGEIEEEVNQDKSKNT